MIIQESYKASGMLHACFQSTDTDSLAHSHCLRDALESGELRPPSEIDTPTFGNRSALGTVQSSASGTYQLWNVLNGFFERILL